MGLSSALATAMSGLRANQASLSIISSNVANAQTPGYVTQASNQIELASGGDGSTVADHRRQPSARSVCAGPVAHRNLGRRLCRPDGEHPGPAAKRLRHAGRQRHAGDDIQQFYLGAAGAIDQFGQLVRAIGGVVGGAIAGAAIEYDDARDSIPAHQCRAGHRQLRKSGQRGHDPDRADQYQAAGPEPDRSRRGDADGSARRRAQSTVEVDGHQGHHRHVQPDQRVHQRRHPAGRRKPRFHDQFQLARRAGRDLAVQRQSGQVRRRDAEHQIAQRRLDRRGREQRHQFGPDRRRPEAARPDPGAGADAGRSAGRDACELAFRQDHSGCRGRRTAFRIRRQPVGRVAGQHGQPDLHRHCDQHPAPDLDRQRDRSGRAAAAKRAQRQSAGDRRRFLRRRGLGRRAIERGARQQSSAVLERGRLAARRR